MQRLSVGNQTTYYQYILVMRNTPQGQLSFTLINNNNNNNNEKEEDITPFQVQRNHHMFCIYSVRVPNPSSCWTAITDKVKKQRVSHFKNFLLLQRTHGPHLKLLSAITLMQPIHMFKQLIKPKPRTEKKSKRGQRWENL